MRTALIDGDSIAYIMGWKFKDSEDENLMQYSVDNFIKSNLILLEATHYIGALSDSSKSVFRNQVYKFAPYKGNRKEEHESIVRWKQFINPYLMEEWNFVRIPRLEADDIVGYHAHNESLGERIICSPDKDLRQIPGELYNYATGIKETITEREAKWHHDMQMLCGDSTDNIKGIPGLGQEKAAKRLKDNPSVYEAYVRHFGNYYGAIIYEETLATVEVMHPNHTHISYFETQLKLVQPHKVAFSEESVFFDGL